MLPIRDRYALYSLVLTFLALHKDVCLLSVRDRPESWKSDWFASGQRTVEEAVTRNLNTNIAKNVILFLGDGMGISTVTAARIYMGQKTTGSTGEEARLAFEKFPHVALAKTYNVNFQVPDSAGTATAFLCGVKANLGTIGVDQNVRLANCSDMTEETKVQSILRWSIAEGKRTGVVTTTRVTHATPAAGYAHSPARDWESDGHISEECRQRTSDIAKQLIFDNNDINVILGGGRVHFLPTNATDPEYGSQFNGSRLDGLDLTQLWREKVTQRSSSSFYVWNQSAFDQIDPEKTDYLMGLFEPSHMKYSLERRTEDPDEPTLAEMTDKAIRILRRQNKGFFLLVEGGRIDHAHHANRGKDSLEEVVSFNDAIEKAVELTDPSDTLIVVTADHSHVFTISGYPTRGNPILGLVDPEGEKENTANDGMPYLTLSYSNGPSKYSTRTNLTGINTEADNFTQPVAVPMDSETHGGEDVAVYAVGPMAHLFHGVQEQNYVAHAMAYASCVGPNKGHCTRHVGSADNAAPRTFEGSSVLRAAMLIAHVLSGHYLIKRLN